MALRKTDKANIKKDYGLLVQVGLVATLLLLIAAFRADLRTGAVENVAPEEQEQIQMEEIIRTEQVDRPPPPPKPPEPVEVPDEQQLEDVDLNLDADLDLAAPVDLPPPPPPPAPTPQPKQEEPEPEIFVVVEQQPEMIPNNEEGMRKLQSSINYPEIAKRAGVEGRVIVQFVVDEQGNVRDPFVVRGIGAGCDEEAMRAVRQLKFKPGKQRGKAVKVQMTLPITFRLK